MSYCMRACKTILALCEEARMKGKNIIRINKIEGIAKDAIAMETEEYSDTTARGNNIQKETYEDSGNKRRGIY